MTDAAPQNAIQAAIAKAKEGAGALSTGLPTLEGAQTGAVIEAAATGVGSYTGGAPIATLDGFLDAGVNLKPDFWLQTAHTGFGVKGHNIPVETLGPVGLVLPDDMQPFYGIRMNIGGTPKYFKTVARDTCLKTGRPWGQILQEAAGMGEREYKGFDIRLVALEDVKDMKGTVVVPAGKTLGYSTSITNFDDIAAFAKKVREKGLFGQNLVLEVRCDVRTNDKNPKGWGALVVDDFTVFTAEIAEAAARTAE